ncbi:immunity protein YezG family protein [Bacillus safensis]|uniref:immunity protein YezG family protein n=1 Tax=Bacillus safensis TaxID=561879 RepID=UPI000DAC1296|nr:immunity protein YezG family protein [Bacillus safensis]
MESIEHYYKKITGIINELIPVKWDKVWMYAEIVDDSSEVVFYFCNSDDGELIFGHKIPQKFNISKSVYKELLLNMLHSFEKLKEDYIKNGLGAWTTATLQLEKSGKLLIDYGHEDIYYLGLNGVQRRAVWKFETFGILPDEEEDKEAVLNFIKNKKTTNI